MAQLQAWRDKATESAKAASEQLRTLALGGLAVIWAFKPEAKDAGQVTPTVAVATPPVTAESAEQVSATVQALPVVLPGPLRDAAFLLIVALTLDLLQYLLNGAIYGVHTTWKVWHGTKLSDQHIVTRWIDVPHVACFYLKFAALAAGMLILARAFFPDWWG